MIAQLYQKHKENLGTRETERKGGVFRKCLLDDRNHALEMEKDGRVVVAHSVSATAVRSTSPSIVDFRINGTLQTGAVGNRTYRSPVW